jgi:hypothetical protein
MLLHRASAGHRGKRGNGHMAAMTSRTRKEFAGGIEMEVERVEGRVQTLEDETDPTHDLICPYREIHGRIPCFFP